MPNLFKEKARVLGISESFSVDAGISYMAGAVMRKDLVLDDVFIKITTLGGSDATSRIIEGFSELKRNDISSIMLDGCILSMYNIVDYNMIYRKLGVPVLCISFKKGKDLSSSFETRGQLDKLRAYLSLGEQKRVEVSGYEYWIRYAGLEEFEAKHLIKSFTVSGRVPEPIRAAKLVARAVMKFELHEPGKV
ncbi:MAG: DUF99 family protein [Nitrososphaeria archaeon]|jgi:endonuclease V-like protein UPF0215 family